MVVIQACKRKRVSHQCESYKTTKLLERGVHDSRWGGEGGGVQGGGEVVHVPLLSRGGGGGQGDRQKGASGAMRVALKKKPQ
jgi:hypothetical protein